MVKQNQSHSTEVADNDTLLSSPSNGIYLSPDNDSRRDSVRSMSVIGDNGIRIKQNIRRNGTLPNLSKGTSSLTHHQPFLHNYLQVPQSRTSQTARSNSSVASMQSDLESCLGDAQFSNDLIEGKAIGLHSFFSSVFPQLPVHCFFHCSFHLTPVMLHLRECTDEIF
ncbi:unnamed protein product [Brugia timori]|uniref:Uncharacterized protein n=1 Tax=Brugia timori TaxID=42155 RepID=A0A0R3QKH7_9BILA|nr:unnamed protein product [Brugia timori]